MARRRSTSRRLFPSTTPTSRTRTAASRRTARPSLARPTTARRPHHRSTRASARTPAPLCQCRRRRRPAWTRRARRSPSTRSRLPRRTQPFSPTRTPTRRTLSPPRLSRRPATPSRARPGRRRTRTCSPSLGRTRLTPASCPACLLLLRPVHRCISTRRRRRRTGTRLSLTPSRRAPSPPRPPRTMPRARRPKAPTGHLRDSLSASPRATRRSAMEDRARNRRRRQTGLSRCLLLCRVRRGPRRPRPDRRIP